jgi:signal transduction histidine kinase
MVKFRQSSFRRILVTRILLLFVPVLLVGEMTALNKARSSILRNARQNLLESAIGQGEIITTAIANLTTNLMIASQTRILQSGSSEQVGPFLTQLSQDMGKTLDCIQLINLSRDNIIAGNCSEKPAVGFEVFSQNKAVYFQTILPPLVGKTGAKDPQKQIQLQITVPVNNRYGELAYALNIQVTLHQQIINQPGSLAGSLVVINDDGTILAHPIAERVGTNIQDNPYGEKILNLLKTAVIGDSDSMNLRFTAGEELVAGYTVIHSPITKNKHKKWIILAVTSVENALFSLEEIKLILIVLTVGLIGASLLASFYLAPYLAGPVEELRDYALNINSHHAAQPIPRNFKIKEFNQLAQAIDQMVERMKAWAEELEIAWKEAKSANQVKSQFLATTSHELRNPLNIIINCIRVVRDDLCDNREEELEFLLRADETAIHLLGIINDLLDISKIEAGKLSVVMMPVDLRQLLVDVINLQSVNIQQKGLQLKCELGDLPIMVKADGGKLKQVLINIIGNAQKFTEKGSISILTEIHADHSQSYVSISVKDTGIGIDPTQQDKLFRPFVMIDGSSTRRFEGTGLGLAISRNLIELMSGKIVLESVGLHQGTTVRITLPLMEGSMDNSTLLPLEKKANLDNSQRLKSLKSPSPLAPLPEGEGENQKSLSLWERDLG